MGRKLPSESPIDERNFGAFGVAQSVRFSKRKPTVDAEITATRKPPSNLATTGKAAESEHSSDSPSVSEREPREAFQVAADMPAQPQPANANHPALQPQGEPLRLTVCCSDLAHAVSSILSRAVRLCCCQPACCGDDDFDASSSEDASSMLDDSSDTDPTTGKGQAPQPGDSSVVDPSDSETQDPQDGNDAV